MKREMFHPVISEPKRKKKVVKKLQQPFPVPIASLTGIKAEDSVWRWYRGQLVTNGRRSSVVVTTENDAHRVLGQMGCFGEAAGHDGAYYRNKERNAAAKVHRLKDADPSSRFVAFSDFDPQIKEVGETRKRTEMAEKAESPEILEVVKQDTDWELSLEESFFLCYALGCLLIRWQNDEMDLDQVFAKFTSIESQFPIRYAVYHHFRTKGWVVKSGEKFGADFLLYKDGPSFYHATYSVRIVADDFPKLDFTSLSGLNRVTESAAKELIIAYVSGPNLDVADEESVTGYLRQISITEILVRRWVSSIERETVEQNYLKASKQSRLK